MERIILLHTCHDARIVTVLTCLGIGKSVVVMERSIRGHVYKSLSKKVNLFIGQVCKFVQIWPPEEL